MSRAAGFGATIVACDRGGNNSFGALLVGHGAVIARTKRNAAPRRANEFDQLRYFRDERTFAEQIIKLLL